MASLVKRYRTPPAAERFLGGVGGFSFGGVGYQFDVPGSAPERVNHDFESYVTQVHRRFGVVASVVANRGYLMSEVVFVWRDAEGRIVDRPQILNSPGGGTTRPHVLFAAEQHVSYSGNAYFWRRNDGIIQLCRPDLVQLMYATAEDVEPDLVPVVGDLIGYRYHRDGLNRPPVIIAPDRMGHWIQEPAPDRRYLGESWVTSVLREIVNDGQATTHISKFFEKAATPSLVFVPKQSLSVPQMKELDEYIAKTYGGSSNAYKAMVVGGGSDVTVVGSKLGELAMAELQGGHETRILMRGMVHPVIVGAREGMQGSSLNAGNYGQTRRLLSDKWFSPATNMLIAAVEHLVRRPNATGTLSFDPSVVQFLQDDRMDEAKIMSAKAAAARQLIDAGYTPVSVTKWLDTGNFADLVHSGRVSVQLLPEDDDSNDEEDAE